MKPLSSPLVIGGGPAGSLFALTVARAGREVTLLESTRAAHDKVCGDFLSRESSLYLQQYGLHPSALGAVAIRQMRLVTPWFQRQITLPFDAWSLTRKHLDDALLTQAEMQGVQVIRGAHVASLSRSGTQWSAILRDEQCVHAEHVALATGKLDVHGWRRPKPHGRTLLAFKMYYRLSSKQRDALNNTVELLLYPGGYAGLQPVQGGLANLCLLVDPGILVNTGRLWDDVLRHLLQHAPHLAERLDSAEAVLAKPLAASSIPYGHLQRTTEEGLWRLGDQAAVIPSFCGDGTSIALHSGALAAACYLGGKPAAAYQAGLHRQLAARMWIAARISRSIVNHPKLSHVTRFVPGLMETIASLTRIPEHALHKAANV